MFGNPSVIAARVVWYPVYDNFEAEFMCFCHETFEGFHCSEFRVDVFVVANSVIAAEFAFAVEFGNRVDRHKPEDVHAEVFKTRQLEFKSFNSAFRSYLTPVYFINYCVAAPFGLYE